MILILLGLIVFATMFGVLAFLLRRPRTDQQILDRVHTVVSSDVRTGEVKSIFVDAKEAAKKNEGIRASFPYKHVSTLIEQAALTITIPAFVGYCALAFLGCLILFWIVLPAPLIDLSAAFAGPVIPYMYVRTKHSKRMREFDKALPHAIDMISRGLKAGHSVPSAFEIVASQAEEPVRGEFSVLCGQMRLGLSQRDALIQMGQRVPSQDLLFMITAVLIQKDSGGNLALLLDRTSQMIYERIRIQGEVRVKTAQARMSGIVLTLMPIALGLIVRITSPHMFSTLINDPIGRILFYYGMISLAVGAIVIRKMTKVEV